MDAFNFINFLKNPGYLHQVSFQEINNLIEQYPFCQNLHYLALRKAQHENHKDFVKKLELAATYSPNRQWLFKQIKDTAAPIGISDETEVIMLEEDPLVNEETEMVTPEVFTENENDHPAFVGTGTITDEDIDDLLRDIDEQEPPLSGDMDDIPESEHTPLTDTDTYSSHPVSDDDIELPAEPALTDESDLNLENPEDMKLPDDKDKRVIYMEDLVEEMPALEESLPIDDPSQNKNNTFTTDPSDEEIAEDDTETSAATDAETEKGRPDIPFEIYDSRTLVVEEEDDEPPIPFVEEPAEAEISEADTDSDIPWTEEDIVPEEEETEGDEQEDSEIPYDDDSIFLAEQTPLPGDPQVEEQNEDDDAYKPEETLEQMPVASLDDEDGEQEDDFDFETDDEEEEEEDNLPAATIAPLPKSAFRSWHQKEHMMLHPSEPQKKLSEQEKKKDAEKEGKIKVIEMEELFKSEQKKKKGKKKNKKKKDTKRFAMESLLEHEDVVSETLAEIIAEQGSRKKAIKMYKRLIELYPEKQEIYLNRIEELKK